MTNHKTVEIMYQPLDGFITVFNPCIFQDDMTIFIYVHVKAIVRNNCITIVAQSLHNYTTG